MSSPSRCQLKGFESLRAAGKIRAWGVSNFTVTQMEDLFRIPQGDRCATNQVYYNLGGRSIERDLLPWCERHSMPVMAYSPLGGPGARLLGDPILERIAPPSSETMPTRPSEASPQDLHRMRFGDLEQPARA